MPTQPSLFDTPQQLTLSELLSRVGNTLNSNPDLRNQWVVAELTDLRCSGGHWYIQLVEKDETGGNRAQVRATIWRSAYGAIAGKFKTITGSELASGMKVLVRGSINFHNVFGLSLNITDIDPSYTIGDIERRRREIINTLIKEGIINQNKSETLPVDTRRIAIISAPGAAGYGDFVDQLTANSYGYVFYPHLFPCVMQGDRTTPSVMAALEMIEESIELWDCVTIIRGGGATNDLIAFDNLDLARRVATFPLPVIVGIGHERDNTVLDEIAHTRCKTPTAVAAFLVDRLHQTEQRVEQTAARIASIAADIINGESRRLGNAASLIPTLASSRIATASERIKHFTATLPIVVSTRLARERQKIENTCRMTLTLAEQHIVRERERLKRFADLADTLSPEATLRRGYSLTIADGKAVTNADTLAPGQKITTRFAKGSVTSTIDNKEPK